MEEFVYNANDPEQVAWVQARQRAREAKLQELWRRMLEKAEAREFLMEVVFAELGPFSAIPSGPPEQTWGEVALHNVGQRWLTEYVWRHTEKYKEMVAEHLKREAEDRKVREAEQLKWRQRERRLEDQGVRNDTSE